MTGAGDSRQRGRRKPQGDQPRPEPGRRLGGCRSPCRRPGEEELPAAGVLAIALSSAASAGSWPARCAAAAKRELAGSAYSRGAAARGTGLAGGGPVGAEAQAATGDSDAARRASS